MRVLFTVLHNVVFNACMYSCSLCMYVKSTGTFVCIPQRDIHTLSGTVRSINTIFRYNT